MSIKEWMDYFGVKDVRDIGKTHRFQSFCVGEREDPPVGYFFTYLGETDRLLAIVYPGRVMQYRLLGDSPLCVIDQLLYPV